MDLREWAVSMLERDNRKSHLAPQLSPASRDVLRGDDPNASQTPTSGDIPIKNADPRSNIASPPSNENHNPRSRSPTKNGSISGRGGVAFHPGLPIRGSTTNSIPKLAALNAPDPHDGNSSSNGPNFNTTTLPMRPAPAGPLPPPPRKQSEDNSHKESRRQATFGNGLYGSGYATQGA